jgi:predicted enzyme related to lactoylglutathione lyase
MSAENQLAHHGRITYLEIPTVDAERSATFYEAVFGWQVERREAGDLRFDDRSGRMIGRWVPERPAAREPGWLPFIYVDRIDDAVARIPTFGGEVVEPPYAEGDLWVAKLRDPAGNLMGVWQFGPR